MLRQKSILDMFARSPMRPLQHHMQQAHACVALLIPFYQAASRGDWVAAERVFAEIRSVEHQADELKTDFCLHLPKNLFLPVSRGDLLVLLSIQDSLANIARDISGIMLGRRMMLPQTMVEGFANYLKRSIDASKQAMDSIGELDELLETGFRGKEVDLVENMLAKLNAIEHETDELQVSLRQQLFAIEDALKPVDVVFLYKIIECVGGLADKAQQAGYQLQLLLAD